MDKSIKIKFKGSLVGVTVPKQKNGNVGRYAETLLENQGFSINKGKGVDLQTYDTELKTRDEEATSAQTVASMTLSDIKNTSYYNSAVHDKFKRQRRVYHKDMVVTSDEVYNFDQVHIQEIVEQAYETARTEIINGANSTYIRGKSDGKVWGYFEKTVKDSNSWDFRIPDARMRDYESMATSTFNKMFV